MAFDTPPTLLDTSTLVSTDTPSTPTRHSRDTHSTLPRHRRHRRHLDTPGLKLSSLGPPNHRLALASQEAPSAGPTPRAPRRRLGIEAGDGRLLRDRPLSRCVSTAHIAQPPPSPLLRPSDPSQPAARAAARAPPCGIATGATPDDPPRTPPAPSPVPARLKRISVALTRVPPRRQARERFGRGRGGGAWACEAEEAPEPGAGAGRTAQRAPGASAPSWRA